MMKVETLNPTNGRKNLYLIKTEESLSMKILSIVVEWTYTAILGFDNDHMVTC